MLPLYCQVSGIIFEFFLGWKRRGWLLASGEPVKNKDDFKELDSVQNKLEIKWNYVKAHHGIHGNEMADKLAKEGAKQFDIYIIKKKL